MSIGYKSRFKLNEWQVERAMGGYGPHCKFWHAFGDINLKVVVFDDGTALAYGLSKTGFEGIEFDSAQLFQETIAGAVEDFASSLKQKLLGRSSRQLDTYRLVNSKVEARVLWAFVTHMVQGEHDRLYDDCFENGDSETVIRALNVLLKEREQSVPKEWTFQLAQSAIAASSHLQLAML